jgi:flagellar assembly protein FliH
MSIKLHRFDFGKLRDFGAPYVVEPVLEAMEEELPPPPPPPVFSEEELDAACSAAKKLGFTEGFDAGQARAAEQLEAQRKAVDATIMELGKNLSSIHGEYRALLQNESQLLTELVLKIAQKVVGVGLDAHGATAIANLLDACLPAVLSKPRLMIELHPAAFDATIDRVESLVHAHGFEGELQFRANESLGVHDVVLDWGTGEATRNTEALWNEIETLLNSTPLTLSLPVTTSETPTA